ncbi:hypothetical protein CR513_58003, partial [Mucuna pruriens]
MTLVAHFDLEIHQMDVKTMFLNGDIDEIIYMVQLENFVLDDFKSMVNVDDNCVHKFSGSKYIFLILYVDDILVYSSDISLLHETKIFLTKNLYMKDLMKASFVLGIQILRDCSQDILRLSQENYIDKILYRFGMKDSKLGDTLIAKGDKFSLKQCPNNDLERNKMQNILYASIVGSLIYTQEVKRVMYYLKKTKGYMLAYRESKGLEIIEYSNSNFAGCQDSKRFTSRYIYMLAIGVISWKFVKQTLITHSTMVAEFMVTLRHPRDMTAKLYH